MAAPQTRAARLLIAQLDDYERGQPLDYISDDLVVYNEMKAAGCIKTRKRGQQVRYKVVTDRGAVSAMTTEALTTFTATNPGIEVVHGNKGFKTHDLIHELDVEEAAGASEIFDLVENRIQWMPEHLLRGFCVEQYTGDGSTDNGYGTNSIIGWNNSIITSGSYGGQSVTTYTALAGQVLSGGVHGTFSSDPLPSLTASILACVRGKDIGSGNTWPSHIFMDVTNFGYVLNAINDIQTRTSHSGTEVLGPTMAKFMNCKLVMDRLAPANRNYVINLKAQEVQTPFGNMIQTRRKKELSPLSEAFLTFFYGRSINRNPRTCARVTTA